MMRSVLVAVALAGCVDSSMPGPREGAKIYDENCVICHGTSGHGDGPLAADYTPAPANLTTLSTSNGGVFPTARVLSQIDGYTRHSDRPDMPEFGLLLRGDTVPLDTGDGVMLPVPRPLAALVAYLQSIQS